MTTRHATERMFYMPHPDSGELIAMSPMDIAHMPLVRFLKESFYKLPDGRYERSVKVACTQDTQLSKAFHEALLNNSV